MRCRSHRTDRPRFRQAAWLVVCLMLAASCGNGHYVDRLDKTPGEHKPTVVTKTPGTGGVADNGQSESVVLAIDFENASHRTGRLIGWNIGSGTHYASDSDTTHPEWRTAEMIGSFQRLAKIRAANGDRPVVRFSGLQIDGTLGGDGYHFWDYVNPDRDVSTRDNMSTVQFHTIFDEIGGDGLITLNFGSGTPAEAAQYVRHLDSADPADPMAAARMAWGREEPWGDKVFEIGNEPYGFWNTGYTSNGRYSYANPDAANGGDPDWFNKPANDPANYAARALAYIEAVLAVQPDARFRVPLAQASMDAWGGIDNAIIALRPLLEHPAVEGVVVHQYLVDDAAMLGFWDKNSPELLMAGSELFRPLYRDLRGLLDTLDRDTPLSIMVTEYHVAGAFSRFRFARSDQAVVGLGIADMLVTFAQLGIDTACQHMAIQFDDLDDNNRELLLEPWYNPFRETTERVLIEMPSYFATKIIADHLLDQTVDVEALQMRNRSYEYEDTHLVYPVVNAVAFADDWLRTGTIVLVNRLKDAEQDVDIKINSGARVTGTETYAPASWDTNALLDATPSRETTYRQRGSRLSLVLPPHSVTALTLDLKPLR